MPRRWLIPSWAFLIKKLKEALAERDARISQEESQRRCTSRWKDGFRDARRSAQAVDPNLKWGEVLKAFRRGAYKTPSTEESQELAALAAKKAAEEKRLASSTHGQTGVAPVSSGTQTIVGP